LTEASDSTITGNYTPIQLEGRKREREREREGVTGEGEEERQSGRERARARARPRKLENDLDRGKSERCCDLMHYTGHAHTSVHTYRTVDERIHTYVVAREERLHTFSHGNRQAIVVIKETDEGTKRRNKRVGWSRPAVYGALHLLAPYNPPRARPVWSHLTSDFTFDSLLANGSRISIRCPPVSRI